MNDNNAAGVSKQRRPLTPAMKNILRIRWENGKGRKSVHLGWSFLHGPATAIHRYRCGVIESALMLLDDVDKKEAFKLLKQLGVIDLNAQFPRYGYTPKNANNASLALKHLPFIFRAVAAKKPNRRIPPTKLYESTNNYEKHYRRAVLLNNLYIELDKALMPHTRVIPHVFAAFLWMRWYNSPKLSTNPYQVILTRIKFILSGKIGNERDEHICVDMTNVCQLIRPFADNFFADRRKQHTDFVSILAAIKEASWEELTKTLDEAECVPTNRHKINNQPTSK